MSREAWMPAHPGLASGCVSRIAVDAVQGSVLWVPWLGQHVLSWVCRQLRVLVLRVSPLELGTDQGSGRAGRRVWLGPLTAAARQVREERVREAVRAAWPEAASPVSWPGLSGKKNNRIPRDPESERQGRGGGEGLQGQGWPGRMVACPRVRAVNAAQGDPGELIFWTSPGETSPKYDWGSTAARGGSGGGHCSWLGAAGQPQGH